MNLPNFKKADPDKSWKAVCKYTAQTLKWLFIVAGFITIFMVKCGG